MLFLVGLDDQNSTPGMKLVFFTLQPGPARHWPTVTGISGGRRLGRCFFGCFFWQETFQALSWPTSKWSVIHKVELGLQTYYLLNMNHFSWEFGDAKIWDTFRMLKTTYRNAQPGWPNRFREPEWCMIHVELQDFPQPKLTICNPYMVYSVNVKK